MGPCRGVAPVEPWKTSSPKEHPAIGTTARATTAVPTCTHAHAVEVPSLYASVTR